MTGAHIHLLLTHVPVLGILFGTVILAYAFFAKRLETARIAFSAFLLSGVASIVVYLTGEAAEDVVENLPGITHAVIERHEEAAIFALAAAVVLGVVALSDLMLSRRNLPRGLTATTLALAIVVSAIMAWTANLGGQINHPEIRSEVVETYEPGRDGEPAEDPDERR